MVQLKNSQLEITISEHGAELTSLRHNGREYLWQADPAYWKRHSPVLFPIVGSVWDGQYRIGPNTYQLSQHGFARDMDFTLLKQTADTAWFRLTSTADTRARYPFDFQLEIGYHLHDQAVDVLWRVTNPSTQQTLPFQIGAHPAFYWPDPQQLGYFQLGLSPRVPEQCNGKRLLAQSVIGQKGCKDPTLTRVLPLDNGLLPLTWDVFAHDALVFEDHQLDQVTLLDARMQPYLSVQFTAPVVGLWSPPGKQAPFVCIEPWYGRCDRVNYTGPFEQRDWMQQLEPQGTFQAQYTITIH